MAKLDRSLVTNIDADPVKRKLVESMRELVADIGVSVIAEGVETKSEYATLVDAGVGLFQGFVIAPPKPGFAVVPDDKFDIGL